MKMFTAMMMAGALAVSGNALAGDAAAGEAAYNGKGCVGCHGPAGKSSNPANPALAGKSADVVSGALKDFKSGARQNATMSAMAAMLSDADVANVAAYLSAQ